MVLTQPAHRPNRPARLHVLVLYTGSADVVAHAAIDMQEIRRIGRGLLPVTVYTATPARATSERPGSMLRRGKVRRRWAHASVTLLTNLSQ